MGTILYLLSNRDGDVTKVWYPLDLGKGMGMNFFYGDGYGITKLVLAPPRCHPYTQGMWRQTMQDPQTQLSGYI